MLIKRRVIYPMAIRSTIALYCENTVLWINLAASTVPVLQVELEIEIVVD